MIEIVSHGNKRKIECGVCQCIFRYEREDTIEVEVQTFDLGQKFKKKHVICPDCGAKLEVYWI